jgi:hypothetical protein
VDATGLMVAPVRTVSGMASCGAGACRPGSAWDSKGGAPGPLTRQLRDRYWASHEDPRYSTPVRYDEPG